MVDQTLSSILGSNVLPKLAPDLTYPADKANSVLTSMSTTGIVVTAGVKSELLSLTGKYAISLLQASNLVSEAMTWDLTIDGVKIWSAVGNNGTTQFLLGAFTDDANGAPETVLCDSSLLLEVTTTTDTSIDLTYKARPIL